jgi:drug/metabolite transporter (DMT)-like permease
MVGLFTGAAQYASLGIAQQYFTPLVLSSAFLIEPLIAQTLGCALNIDEVPGAYTIVGAIISLFGIFMITKGGFENKKKEETNNKDEIPLIQLIP